MEGENVLTDAERRERRRQRILQNSENRMNRILSGPGGEETRLAPAMEGGEGFKILPSTFSTTTSSEPQVLSDNIQQGTSQNFVPTNGKNPQKLRKMNVVIAVVFGILMRFITLYIMEVNVMLPWFILFFTLEYLTYSVSSSKIGNEQIQMLFSMLPPSQSKYAQYLPVICTVVPRFMQDSVSMIAGFMAVHLPIFYLSKLNVS